MVRPVRGKRTNRRDRQRARIAFLSIFLATGIVVVWLVSGRYRHEVNSAQYSMERAKAYNASVPFVRGRIDAARPFWFRGTPAAREQAVQCLATAALYEAGDDRQGQKAVIQVVLNRVALPQYPKTVCGVVYEGSDRASGCQFSFACDGSITRRPEHDGDGWQAARVAARRALAGRVFAAVGTATHYHTDWIVPYWMPSLDKIAQVHDHIFYRPHQITPRLARN
jgi:spore germination cell wall hydrolase CwlJ-like protein